jgi:hypothetical protein
VLFLARCPPLSATIISLVKEGIFKMILIGLNLVAGIRAQHVSKQSVPGGIEPAVQTAVGRYAEISEPYAEGKTHLFILLFV